MMMFALRWNAQPWVMWSFPLFFFAYQFVLRLWPSLLMPEIMSQFTIDATAFGFLSAVYYFGYAGMQIPLALCLDHYGAKRVIALSIFICGCATWLFTSTESWCLALLGRFLVGAGSAAGFLGISKAVALWFPRDRYSTMIGLSFSFGLLGALYGGKPISYLIEATSWQGVGKSLAWIAIFFSVIVLLFFKVPQEKKVNSEQGFTWQGLKSLFKTPALLSLAIANLFMVGSLEGFADVWGVNYLVEAYQISKSEAAGLISFIFFGMLFGGPLLAYGSRKWGCYQIIVTCSLGMAFLFGLILMGQNVIHWYGLALVLFCIGLLCCYQVIVFEAGANLVGPGLLSVTIAFLNCINMLGGSFFHTIIGYLMDLFWTGGTADSVKIYTVDSYQYALLAIPVFCMLGGSIVYGLHRVGIGNRARFNSDKNWSLT